MDKEKDKKDINLMPEDLRSKEAGLLSKGKNKNDFDFDIVSPKESAIKKESVAVGFSLVDKLKNIFNPPARFGQTEHHMDKPEEKKILDNKAKIEENKKPQPSSADLAMHLPNNEKNSQAVHFTVNYTKDSLANVKEAQPKISQHDKSEHKDGSTWLDKLKKIFQKKSGQHKIPKVELVPPRPIMPRELPDVTVPIKNDKGLVDIWDEKNIKGISSLSPKNNEEPKIQLNNIDKNILATPKDVKPVDEGKGTGFYIPATSENNKSKTKVSEKKDAPDEFRSFEESKFHKPSSRARAKLLDEGGGVDLIPDAAKVRSWRQIIRLLITTVFSFLLVLAIFYGFLFYQGKKIEEQKAAEDAQITNLERQIVDYQELNKQITKLGREIKNIHQLLSLHFYWTNFFQLLEKYTIEGVHYSGMTAGNGGAMTLEAQATDFETMAKQIKILQQTEAQEFVSSISVSTAEYNKTTNEVTFNITIILNTSLFLYNENYLYEMSTLDLYTE